MLKLIKAASVVVGLCGGFSAQAGTVSYDVTGTVHETGFIFGLWIKGGVTGAQDETYAITETGSLIIQDDGTAQFLAKARDVANPANGFDLAFDLDSDFSDNIDTTPEFKSVFDAVSDPGVFFLDLEGGSLSGVGDLAGLDLGVNRFPVNGEVVFQIGGGVPGVVGANQHTDDFGMSGWFQITSVDSATCIVCSAIAADNSILVGQQADVNVDLAVVSAVPLPAGALLLLTGLGAVGLAGRRRRS